MVEAPAGDGRDAPEVAGDQAGGRFLPGSRSFQLGRGAMAVVLFLAYVLVLLAYARSTVGAGVDAQVPPPRDGVAAHFVPTALDASAPAMTGLLYVVPGSDLVDERGRLRVDMSVDVLPVLGPGSATFSAGQAPAPMELVVSGTGDVRNYPFDDYAFTIVSTVATRATGDSAWSTVPVVVGAEGELGGWTMGFATPTSVEIAGVAFTTADGFGLQSLTARRALSTVALAVLVILLMVLLAVMTAAVARAVALRRRRIEPALASWMAALLFALVPLRNFLPGAPPLGSWIDVLVFFWVEIVIMLALAVYVATWLRDGAPSDHRRPG